MKEYDLEELDGLVMYVENVLWVECGGFDLNWIMSKECMEYCYSKIIEIFDGMVYRLFKENFDVYFEWCYFIVNLVLNKVNKVIIGDECEDVGDRWVICFVIGFRLLFRLIGVGWKLEEEVLFFKLVWEECDMFIK